MGKGGVGGVGLWGCVRFTICACSIMVSEPTLKT